MEKHAEYRQASLHECNQMTRHQAKNARLAGEDLRNAIAKAAYAAWKCWRFSHGDPKPRWDEALPTEREDFTRWADAALAGNNDPAETQREALLVLAIADVLGMYSALDANINEPLPQETMEQSEAAALPVDTAAPVAMDGKPNTTESMDHATQGGTSGDTGEPAHADSDVSIVESGHADGQDALPAGQANIVSGQGEDAPGPEQSQGGEALEDAPRQGRKKPKAN